MNRYKDWLEQAEHDLEAAFDSLESEHYEWSCFQAQQVAEKSFKAL
jgi:HEPN domain-containing protein